MLEVGRLRTLLAISEHGGSSGAARALGTPAGEVAGQVSDWEHELGLPLLDGDRLTPAGRRLAEHAGRLLGQLEAAESDAAAVAGRAAGTLRLGVGADAGRVLLVDALPALRSSELTVHVRQLADEQVGALGSTLDVVVVGEYGAAVPHRPDPAVERHELFTEPLLLAVPTRHRATGASVRLAELAGDAWIGGTGDALVALERAAAGAGYAPRLVAEAGEDALALTLVAAGLGVALVPASAVPAPAEGVRFLTVLDGGLRRTVVAAYRRSAAADPGVRRLLDALAAAARRVAAAVPGVTAAAGAAPSSAPPSSPPSSSPGRKPDPLFDPLPDASPPSPRNGRRDPWADRVPPETNGVDLPPRNGTSAFGTPSGTELPARNGSAGDLPPLPPRPPVAPRNGTGPELPGTDGSGRNGTSGGHGLPGGFGSLPAPGGPPPGGSLPGGGPLPGGPQPGGSQPGGSQPGGSLPGGDLPGRSGSHGDQPSRNAAPSDLPGLPGGDRPGRHGGPSADLPGGDLPGRGGFGDLPAGDLPGGTRPGRDLPGRGEPSRFADQPGGDRPAGNLPGRDRPARNAPGSELSDSDLSGLGGFSRFADRPGGDRPGNLPGRDVPGRGEPSRPGDLPGGDRPGPAGPADLPSRGAGGSGFGGLPPAPDALPAPGLPAPGAEPARPGAGSPYRTPPPTGDPADLPRFGNDLAAGPNPYRPDTSAHPAPDPFRAGGPDGGPNPYRSNGAGQPASRRGDSLGGAELFAASQRAGMPPRPGTDGGQLPPAAGLTSPDLGVRSLASPGTPGRSRAAARGGDGAEGTLPPAPAGAAADVRLSIFEDLQSEWFVQPDETAQGSWQMAADDGWRAAAKLAEPTTAGTTTAGLPRRRPQAMAVPGAVGGPAGETPLPVTTHRSPQEVRGRLSSYRDGVRRGRHAERPADEAE